MEKRRPRVFNGYRTIAAGLLQMQPQSGSANGNNQKRIPLELVELTKAGQVWWDKLAAMNEFISPVVSD